MKLRILGNSIRLRILQPELATLHERGLIEEAVQFGPTLADCFRYQLVTTDQEEPLLVNRIENGLQVSIRRDVVDEMATSERVGINAEVPVGADTMLAVLVEKDFKCLEPRPGDQQAFPHPNEENGERC